MVRKILKVLPGLIVFLFLISMANAAMISGEIYDLDLEIQENVIVEINTKPKQQTVAKDGSYEFAVPQGTYTLSAKYMIAKVTRSSAEYSVEVEQEGDYVVDLILFPAFEEEEDILSEIEKDIKFEEETDFLPYMIAALIAAAAIYIWWRKRNDGARTAEKGEAQREDAVKNELREIIRFIKKEGGRTTQKDIRNRFPQSEAKISLIIAELEDKGIVKKIKKGRGNIIILNR